ncbi:MAG: hypothetical protein KBS81_05355 [Spirochaetales bacterium]|nr:hypothetical protein [Candidatus Physcosoma equi]
MFGYVLLSGNNATPEEKKTYKEFYCGLCHVLEEKYGKAGTMALSYDMVFLSMLLSDLESAPKTRGTERCTIHPLKPHDYTTTPTMEYGADMQMLLSYYSALDHAEDNDEEKTDRKVEKYQVFMPELEKKYPRQCAKARENLAQISYNEKHPEEDQSMNPLLFGEILGEIFCHEEQSFFASSLWSLGCSLGRFIYILDAWDDRKKDWKNGAYNPFTKETKEEDVKNLLIDAAASASIAFEALALDEYVPILSNIIYSGIWSKFKGEEK